MKYSIVTLPGDGIGPEIMNEAIKVLEVIGKKFGHQFNFEFDLVGGAAIDKHGVALTDKTLEQCKKADAVLLGAVGGPKWDDPLAKVRPEDGLLALRKGLGLYANLRPVKMFKMLENSTPLKPETVRDVDLVVVRELTGGLYYGKPKKRWTTKSGKRRGVDSMYYTEAEIERIVRVGFNLAMTRRKKLTSVDKANVLESSRLWRQITAEISKEYPEVELDNMLVDACTMRLIQNPRYFDVIVTENTFGDIITDESSMLAGSMGMLPSASIAGFETKAKTSKNIMGLYEPIHGSAPKYTGLNIINPTATILSGAMMLRYSFHLEKEAAAIENAVLKVLDEGYRTKDIMSAGMKQVSTKEAGTLIAEKI